MKVRRKKDLAQGELNLGAFGAKPKEPVVHRDIKPANVPSQGALAPPPRKLLPRDPRTIERAKRTVDDAVIEAGHPLLARAYLEEVIAEATERLANLPSA